MLHYKKSSGGISITIFIRGYRTSTTRTNLAKKNQVGEPTVRSNAAGHFDWLVRKEMKCQLHPPHQLPQEANNSLAPAHVRGCARYGQRGPDEETEMNFMSAGQCPAVKATRTAGWCQHRKFCFQVPMHFATDALPAFSYEPCPCLWSDRLLEQVADRNCRKNLKTTNHSTFGCGEK